MCRVNWAALAEMQTRKKGDLNIYLSPLDRPLSHQHQFDSMQTSLPSKLPSMVDIFDGQIMSIGNLEFTVMETPGHTPGHVSLHCKEHGFLVGGEMIIPDSIGRADLPGGNRMAMRKSIRRIFASVPDETRLFACRMLPSTIGKERRYNMYVRDALVE